MSDPVSNSEVEDVLASVRRLVSDENRPSAPRAANPTVEAGKLVLTPSLRVMTPDSEAPVEPEPETCPEPEREDAAAQDARNDAEDMHPDPARAPRPSLSEKAAEAPMRNETAVAAENARVAAVLVHALTGEKPDVMGEMLNAAKPVDPDETTRAQPAALKRGSATPASASFTAEARSNPRSLSAKIAALEAAVGKSQGEWEPDGISRNEPLSGTESPVWPWEDHIAGEEDGAAGTAWPSSVPDVAEVEPDPDLEPELAERSSDPEPAAVSEQGGAEGDVDETLEDLADLSDEPALLDEEALYDMVAEIVRQELQGALGERITRNVRKLVRREIQRALAAHDLD